MDLLFRADSVEAVLPVGLLHEREHALVVVAGSVASRPCSTESVAGAGSVEARAGANSSRGSSFGISSASATRRPMASATSASWTMPEKSHAAVTTSEGWW